MKKIFVLLFMIFFIQNIFSSIEFIYLDGDDENYTDNCGPHEEKLNGKIKEVITTQYNNQGSIYSKTDIKYNINDLIIEYMSFDPQQQKNFYSIYKYNDKNNLVEIDNLDENKKLINKQTWMYDNRGNIIDPQSINKYDDKNRIIEKKELYSNNEVKDIYQYVYDNNNNIINELLLYPDYTVYNKSILIYNKNNKIIEYSNYESYEDSNYKDFQLLKKFTWKYNEKNKIIEKIEYNYNLVIVKKIEWKYNEFSELIEKSYYDSDKNVISKKVNTYDKDILKSENFFDDKNKLIKYYKYDSGKIIEFFDDQRGKTVYDNTIKNRIIIKNYDIEKLLDYTITDFDDNGKEVSSTEYASNNTIRSKSSHKYKYDKYKNIILEEDYDDDHLETKTERQISYFD